MSEAEGHVDDRPADGRSRQRVPVLRLGDRGGGAAPEQREEVADEQRRPDGDEQFPEDLVVEIHQKRMCSVQAATAAGSPNTSRPSEPRRL